MKSDSEIRVLLAPFWRYAVGPASGMSCAIPFYRLSAAKEFFAEAKRELPWSGVRLYKRVGLRGIVVVTEYFPEP